MSINSCNILGVEVDAVTIDDSIAQIKQWAEAKGLPASAKLVVKPYVEFMTKARADEKIADILNSADLCLPDGVSLQWGASFIYGGQGRKPNIIRLAKSLIIDLQKASWRNKVLPEKFAGISFTSRLLDVAAESSWRVGVIGGDKDTEHTKAALKQLWPELNLVEVWTGYSRTTATMDFASSQDDNEYGSIIASIAQGKIDVLLVAMGFPRQEVFMDENRSGLGVKVMIGEGGTFDYRQMGGKVLRAPNWMQRAGLEWLWRLFLQPKRLKRQLAIPKYIWQVFQQAKRNYSDTKPQK